MSLQVELTSELEAELASEAAQLGLQLPDYVLRLLAGRREPRPLLRNGAELLRYWQSEGLVGAKPEILDSQKHARALREEAEKRPRP